MGKKRPHGRHYTHPGSQDFNLWKSIASEDDMITYATDEQMDAWRAAFFKLCRVHDLDREYVQTMEHIGIQKFNCFSRANTFVRRGLLPPDEVTAVAFLIFGNLGR